MMTQNVITMITCPESKKKQVNVGPGVTIKLGNRVRLDLSIVYHWDFYLYAQGVSNKLGKVDPIIGAHGVNPGISIRYLFK